MSRLEAPADADVARYTRTGAIPPGAQGKVAGFIARRAAEG